jgi:cell division protease FtsH
MGGATFALPERDRTMFTRRYCIALIKVCFGGRIAEEMFCDDISSGAVSDIQQATRISRQMVTAWGMSDKLGPIMYVGESGDAEASYYMAPEREYSERTAEMIDNEIKRIIDEAYQSTKELIKSKNVVLEAIAKSLLKYETLSADDVKIILDGGELTKPTVADLLAVEQAKNGSDDADTKQEENQQEVSSEDDSDDDKENSPGGDQKNPKN